MTASITIVILSARPTDELPALKATFNINQDANPDGNLLGIKYWKIDITGCNVQKIDVIIACIAESGNIAAALSTERLIIRFHPDVMFFVGISCGIRKYVLGDVVTSETIWGYEYVRTTPQEILDRSRAKTVLRQLLRDVMIFNSEELSAWHTLYQKLRTTIPPRLPQPSIWPDNPELHRNIWIASGEKVMGNSELIELNRSHDKIQAGEMEGLGFAEACGDQKPPVPWLVVRGVSDYGDDTKDGSQEENLEKDQYHYTAALSAATFTRIFIEKCLTLGKLEYNMTGILDRYPRSENEYFFSAAKELIPQSNKIILIATGLNLIWSEDLKELLVNRAKSTQVNITLCLGNPESPHVKRRDEEEQKGKKKPTLGLGGTMQLAESVLGLLSQAGNPENFQLLMFNNYPTFATLIFDEHIFFYPYGYQTLGNYSPVFHLLDDGSDESKFFIENAESIIDGSDKAIDVIQRLNRYKY
ncbi:hypothetical protein ACFLYL_03550 [Chloroflexota bacterium]